MSFQSVTDDERFWSHLLLDAVVGNREAVNAVANAFGTEPGLPEVSDFFGTQEQLQGDHIQAEGSYRWDFNLPASVGDFYLYESSGAATSEENHPSSIAAHLSTPAALDTSLLIGEEPPSGHPEEGQTPHALDNLPPKQSEPIVGRKPRTRRVEKPPRALACYFCRGRKIKCNTVKDTDTCGPCLHRGETCVFPEGSHRGTRNDLKNKKAKNSGRVKRLKSVPSEVPKQPARPRRAASV